MLKAIVSLPKLKKTSIKKGHLKAKIKAFYTVRNRSMNVCGSEFSLNPAEFNHSSFCSYLSFNKKNKTTHDFRILPISPFHGYIPLSPLKL